MKLTQQEKQELITAFEEDTEYERVVMKLHNPAFKMRHLKKLLKKADEGRKLNKREQLILKPVEYPIYDMDGSYYHPDVDPKEY